MLASGVFAGVFTPDYAWSREDRGGAKYGDELARIGARIEILEKRSLRQNVATSVQALREGLEFLERCSKRHEVTRKGPRIAKLQCQALEVGDTVLVGRKPAFDIDWLFENWEATIGQDRFYPGARGLQPVPAPAGT